MKINFILFCAFCHINWSQLLSGCPNNEFQCASGQCIDKNWRCDSMADCADRSDELNCKGTQPVLLVAKRGSISKQNLAGNATKVLASNFKNSIAFDFDIQMNKIFINDAGRDNIYGGEIGNNASVAQLFRTNHDAEGIAFDWITKHLYWTDSNNRTICVTTTDGQFEKVLVWKNISNPRSIILDPLNGHLYWSDWGRSHPGIKRISMDGNEVTRYDMVTTNIVWPNGISIDFTIKKLYWVDAKLKRLEVIDLDGKNRKILNKSPQAHFFGIANFGDHIFLGDWRSDQIFSVNKWNGKIKPINKLEQTFTLKIYHKSKQPSGKNPCEDDDSGCSHLCLIGNVNGTLIRSCVCPTGFVLDQNNKTCKDENGGNNIKTTQTTTVTVNKNCTGFACDNATKCLQLTMKCDGKVDCIDGNDEFNCTKATTTTTIITKTTTATTITKPESCDGFKCNSTSRCIPKRWLCDGDIDCNDGSDEVNCTKATTTTTTIAKTTTATTITITKPESCDGFKCNSTSRCIPKRWLCDGDIDCNDGSDEINCKKATITTTTATLATTRQTCYGFRCRTTSRCIPKISLCNGIIDCFDGSDEVNCTKISSTPFPQTCSGFKCSSTSRCIPKRWQCDGDIDCNDGSDEVNCTKATPTTITITKTTTATTITKPESCDGFKCSSTSQCIPNRWQCDGDIDCNDGSDEVNCTKGSTTTTIIATTTTKPGSCGGFRCSTTLRCIPKASLCNGKIDCFDHSDEVNCTKSSTTPSSRTCNGFRCNSTSSCIPKGWQCDGESDCNDGSDEMDCEKASCNGFRCKDTSQCIASVWRCDRQNDCSDGSDEMDCAKVSCDGFKCSNTSQCIPKRWQCDGDIDCNDGSDEVNCTKGSTTTTIIATTTTKPGSCGGFRCSTTLRCIPKASLCNGIIDCFDHSDEVNCTKSSTTPSSRTCNGFRCNSTSSCIPKGWQCDGENDCNDGSDEMDCKKVSCIGFRCKDTSQCIASVWRCDGENDCSDGSDEINCATIEI